MALLNIPTKSTGDTFTATELNTIVSAIQGLQSEKGHAVYFDDEYTESVPQVISGASYVAIENNKANLVETYLPYGVTTLFDGTKIIPPSTGTGFSAYVSFYAKSSGANSYFEFGIDIDGTFNEIFNNAKQTVKGANTYQPYYIPINGYMLDTFVANGGVPKLKPKSGDTISIYGTVFYINVGYQQQ
jgi:hypothetical protein